MKIEWVLFPSLCEVCWLHIIVTVDEICWEGGIDDVVGDDDRIAVSRNCLGSEPMICEEFHEEVCSGSEFVFVLWIR